jgi:hypothetical protein
MHRLSVFSFLSFGIISCRPPLEKSLPKEGDENQDLSSSYLPTDDFFQAYDLFLRALKPLANNLLSFDP